MHVRHSAPVPMLTNQLSLYVCIQSKWLGKLQLHTLAGVHSRVNHSAVSNTGRQLTPICL